MGNYLNLVYDVWDETTGKPVPNWETVDTNHRYRVPNGLLNFYNFSYAKDRTISDVYENHGDKFYYFINHVSDLLSVFQNGTNEIPLSKEVQKCLKECPNFYVLFLNEHEFESEKCIKLLHKKIEANGLNAEQFYMVNNNGNLNLYKERIGTKINMYSINFLPSMISRNLGDYSPAFVTEKVGDFFLTHNRTPKNHRYCLLTMLKKNNLLEEFDWSFVMGWDRLQRTRGNFEPSFYEPIFVGKELEEMMPEIQYFEKIELKKSKYEEDKTWFDKTTDHFYGINWGTVFVNDTYQNSYINVTTESSFFSNEIHLTEKSFKPLFFHQIPIYLATPGHIKEMRERYDFDFFDDIINHKYDLETDHRKRFYMIIDEIKRIARNKNHIIEFYKKNEQRFFSNSEKVKKIQKDRADYDFFLSLMKNINE